MVLALTACGSISKPWDTSNHLIRTVEVARMPSVPAELFLSPIRPEPPRSGRVEDVLHHAVAFGAYVQELEQKQQAWQDWLKFGQEIQRKQ